MSLQYNDTVNYKGIVQTYEKEAGFNFGDISGNVQKLKSFTADVNLAMDDYLRIALKASGTWQFDDSNHTDYPIIFTDLISGQQDYTFVKDGSNNLILDIYKVVVRDQNGYGREIYPVDQQTTDTQGTGGRYPVADFYDNQPHPGVPLWYDKTANGIFLDCVPNYTTNGASTGVYGLEIYINREASYFVYTDTTKMPGVPGTHHKYFALKPALDYARRNNLAILPRLEAEVLKYEGDEDRGIIGRIARDFSNRPRDEVQRMTPAPAYTSGYGRGYYPGSGRLY